MDVELTDEFYELYVKFQKDKSAGEVTAFVHNVHLATEAEISRENAPLSRADLKDAIAAMSARERQEFINMISTGYQGTLDKIEQEPRDPRWQTQIQRQVSESLNRFQVNSATKEDDRPSRR